MNTTLLKKQLDKIEMEFFDSTANFLKPHVYEYDNHRQKALEEKAEVISCAKSHHENVEDALDNSGDIEFEFLEQGELFFMPPFYNIGEISDIVISLNETNILSLNEFETDITQVLIKKFGDDQKNRKLIKSFVDAIINDDQTVFYKELDNYLSD